jgi:hypothetical protein
MTTLITVLTNSDEIDVCGARPQACRVDIRVDVRFSDL